MKNYDDMTVSELEELANQSRIARDERYVTNYERMQIVRGLLRGTCMALDDKVLAEDMLKLADEILSKAEMEHASRGEAK